MRIQNAHNSNHHKMSKRRNKNEIIRATMDCLHELKTQIGLDPFVQTSPIVETFNLNGAIVDQLKTLGIVVQTESDGKFWIGTDPDVNMVNAIKKLQQSYVRQYRERKKSDEFVRIMPNGFKVGKTKPQPFQREMNFTDMEQQQLRSIKLDPQIMEKWKQSMLEQQPEITNIPIQNTFDQSMVSEFINHDEPIIEKPVRKRTPKQQPERIFEFRLFGIKFFSIKY